MIRIYIFATLFLFFTGCLFMDQNRGRTFDEMVKYYEKNSEEISQFGIFFMEQSEIKNIMISDNNHSNCMNINQWTNCNTKMDQWEMKDELSYVINSKKNLEGVLAADSISEDTYNKIVTFLSNHSFDGLGKDVLRNSTTFELNDRLVGIKYFTNHELEFSVDDEYLQVENVAPQWFVYIRDWN